MTVDINSKNIIVYVDISIKLNSEQELEAFKTLLDDAEKGYCLRFLPPDDISKIELDIINNLRKNIQK